MQRGKDHFGCWLEEDEGRGTVNEPTEANGDSEKKKC
jgi:hypothetical protein